MTADGEQGGASGAASASAREIARQVLRRVGQGEAYASLALAGALERARPAAAERALATELVYGVLRHQTRLDRALASHATRGGLGKLSPAALVALRMAAYQILFLRVPAHAAVDDAVDAVRAAAGERVAGFANAVLRKLAERGEPPPPPATDPLATLEELWSLPRWIGQELVRALGKSEAIAAGEALARPAPVTLRASLDRVTREALAARVAEERPAASVEASPACPEALLVRGGGAPETLAVFQEGLCTVQDVGAQLCARTLGAAPGERLLDACAGVGGKATHLAQLARAAGGPALVHAADASRRKLDLCEDSARRLGLGAEEVVAIEADLTAEAPPGLLAAYDRVLLDAPCSGLGVLRRHPEAKWRMRPRDVRELQALQARLLERMLARVRPGGALVYSVCTFTEEEGPAQIERFLAAHPEVKLETTVRTWPHRDDADAFFIARMVRPT